nr:pitrilysin family protein [Dissulfurirhabdus thermomarina]
MGSPESVTRFDSERLRAYTREAYTAPRVLVTAAGSVRHEALVEAIAPAFTAVPVQGRPSARQPALPGTGAALHEKDLEQVHLVLGCRGPAAADPRRHAALLLNVMLGGSMSSRLFQEIREKRGLAYSVYSFLSPYEDAGLLGMYAGVAPGKAAEVAALAAGELERLASGGVTDRELDEAKSHLRGNLFLAMENTDTRMTRLARNEIHFGRFIPPEEALGTLEAVEPAEVQELAAWCREGGLAVAALGPIGEPDARALEALAVGA